MGGNTKVEELLGREEKEERCEKAIARKFVEVVEIIDGAGPLRSRRGAMPGISTLPSSRENKAWRGMGVGSCLPIKVYFTQKESCS